MTDRLARFVRSLPLWLSLAGIMLISRVAAAAAAQAVNPDDQSWIELLRPVYDALTGKHYALGGALLTVAAVALIKRYGAGRFPWLKTSDRAHAVMNLLGASALAMTVSLGVPDAHASLAMLRGALMVGVGTAGGVYVLAHLLVEPVLKPLADKAPAWMQPLFALVFALLDHPSPGAAATAAAERAGAAAVAAKPGDGIAAVTGKPTEIE